jgi:hypothetical protein
LKACLVADAREFLSYFNEQQHESVLPDLIRRLIRNRKNEMAAGLIKRYPMQVLTQWIRAEDSYNLEFIVRTLSQTQLSENDKGVIRALFLDKTLRLQECFFARMS